MGLCEDWGNYLKYLKSGWNRNDWDGGKQKTKILKRRASWVKGWVH